MHRRQVTGGAAAVGGLLWALKSSTILITGRQPPVIFEGAAISFGVAAVGLALAVPTVPRRHLLLVISVVGFAAAVVALVGGEAVDFALLPASLAVLVVLVAAGGALRSGSAVARLIGLGTIPLIAAGGLLSTANERLLEVPLLVLSFLWIVLGWQILRTVPAVRSAALALRIQPGRTDESHRCSPRRRRPARDARPRPGGGR